MNSFLGTSTLSSDEKEFEGFLKREFEQENKKNYEKLRLVGYALDITYDGVTVITNDAYKLNVGGIPRGSFLVMAPKLENGGKHKIPTHYILLRVEQAVPTPLSSDVQKTFFEMQKRAMPEIDTFTEGELQWGALKSSLVGCLYLSKTEKVTFSGDIPNFVSPYKYRVYSPDKALLDLILNYELKNCPTAFEIGKYRATECEIEDENSGRDGISILVDAKDFRGQRCALFGKTRQGKSNTVKNIAAAMIEKEDQVGQLIFDTNGEYANTNEQNLSIRERYPDRCVVYALKEKKATPSRPLKLDFYKNAPQAIKVLYSLLEAKGHDMKGYLGQFARVELPDPEAVKAIKDVSDSDTKGRFKRDMRKLQMYWLALSRAGFPPPDNLKDYIGDVYDPGFNSDVRKKCGITSQATNWHQTYNQYSSAYAAKGLKSSSGNPLFEEDDLCLLKMLFISNGYGTKYLKAFTDYHSNNADDFIAEIGKLLKDGKKTVIIDLSHADTEVAKYYTQKLSVAVFQMHEELFAEDILENHFTQIYFEEAHNFFPRKESNDTPSIYARFLKEGAKFHIGITYSTQSPSTIHAELLSQTENFFVAHVGSEIEIRDLEKSVAAFKGHGEDIIKTRTKGFIRMMTASKRFVIPCQIKLFEENRATKSP